MKKVMHIFSRKGRHTVSVSPDTTVLEALRLMSDKNTGSVVIMDNGEYLGLVTERDYSRKVVLMGKSSNETRVASIMTTNLPTVTEDTSVEECMQLMSNRNARYLPVFNGNNYVGIISIHDVVRETISAQQETIDHLHSFIYSNG
ncbi:CBS domain-containing protein [Filimonas effusa]|uniref:CBS domain-containing protein n=1 Tax=Filimonas effusa TaxID=2508721 RepID=A0A4Q1D3J1_9BACT|nr:CBS domain-containing protein [Filimonas effusa]RXK82945.1 CBS domain-containing protein [Filimonas effusa]